MNIVLHLIEMFFEEEKYNIILLIIFALVLTLFQTNAISYVTSQIIQSAQSGKTDLLVTNYKWFVAISVTFMIMYYIFKRIQTNLLVKMVQWVKNQIFKIILKMNNVNISNVNFLEFALPISRISNSFFILFSNLISSIIPTSAFLIAITGYLFYKNATLALIFLIGNFCIGFYIFLFWDSMLLEKKKHETIANENEYYIKDVLNNIDKVIYRGQCNNELEFFDGKTNRAINVAQTYINVINNNVLCANVIVYITMFTIGGYLIRLKIKNGIDTSSFITFFTILLLYRDRMLSNTNEIGEYVEFMGRIHYINAKFNEMIGTHKNLKQILTLKYKPIALPFNRVTFKDVSFRYDGTDKWVLSHFNSTFELKKIIGITGLSGRGKSSFVKLLLRLHEPTEGDVFIDDTNLKDMDPHYIRQNITYVNQNSKLFNKKIIENIMYGCRNTEKCDSTLSEILKYKKIKELFKNLDIKNDLAGNLGENLSGGQRQVVNIIGGLINPSLILILDEPTNALDKDLKTELLSIIAKFKNYKKAILIITHDRDMYPLFDKTIDL